MHKPLFLLLLLLVALVVGFDFSSIVLFPNPESKNYPPKPKKEEVAEDEDEVKTGRARKLEPPRVKAGVHCPSLGFSKYDHLMLTQYWPTSLCYLSIIQGSYCKVAEVKSKYSEGFLIHGMWPINLHRRVRGGLIPQCCNNSHLFNYNRDLIRQEETSSLMEKVWPEILIPEAQREDLIEPHGIWSHEWIKHGTCFIEGDRDFAKNIPGATIVESYLLHAMRLRNQVHIYAALEKEDIIAHSNQTYSVKQIKDAFYKHFGSKPELSCLTLDELPHQALYQVMICIHKDELKKMKDPKHMPKLVDCSYNDFNVTNYRNLRRCAEDEQVMIPSAATTLQHYYDLEDGSVFNYDPSKQQESNENIQTDDEEEEDWDWDASNDDDFDEK